MPEKPRRPHDEFFREAFSRRDIVTDYLRVFLPARLLKKLRLEKLKLLNTSYTTEQLSQYFSDIVYACPYGAAEQEVKITLLFEHKSTPARHPHLQLLRYQLQIWEENLKQKEPLSPVIPLVFYHGAEKWEYRPFSSYFDGIDPDLLPFLPRFDYLLTDTNQLTDEQLLSLRVGWLINTLLLFKHADDIDYLYQNYQLIFRVTEQTIADSGEKNYFQSLFVYFFRAADLGQKDEKIVKDMLQQLDQPAREEGLKIYDRLIEVGIEQGIEKGIEQGLELGREEKTRQAVLKMLDKGYPVEEIADIQDIPVEEVLCIKQELEDNTFRDEQ